MTMIYHSYMLEEQVRQHKQELEALNRDAWMWSVCKTRTRLPLMAGWLLGLLGRWR